MATTYIVFPPSFLRKEVEGADTTVDEAQRNREGETLCDMQAHSSKSESCNCICVRMYLLLAECANHQTHTHLRT